MQLYREWSFSILDTGLEGYWVLKYFIGFGEPVQVSPRIWRPNDHILQLQKCLYNRKTCFKVDYVFPKLSLKKKKLKKWPGKSENFAAALIFLGDKYLAVTLRKVLIIRACVDVVAFESKS